MTNSKFYRVLSLVLAFVMTVSLFSNWTMPVFATSGIKSNDLAPVISTTLKGEVTLYSDVKDDAPSTNINCEEEINVDLYKKFVVEETGKVFYAFYATSDVSDELAKIFQEYHFIQADAVCLPELETTPEPTVESSVEPILDTLEDNPISNDVTTGNFNVDEEGNYYIAHTTGIIVKSADEKMATVRNITVEPVSKANGNIPVGSADYLIWNNSLFCDITLTDENGNEVYLDGTVDVIFPKDIVPFKVETDHTKSYYTYRFDDDGTVYSNGTYEYKPDTDLVATYDGLSVVGFAAVVFEKNGSFSWFDEPFEVVSKGETINLYMSTQVDQTKFKKISVSNTDKFTVESKITYTDGIDEVELYFVAYNGYAGSNDEVLDLINGDYPLIRVSDVEKYVEPTPTPTPTPTPEPPALEDVTLTDPDTGIIVSGSLPAGVTLFVEKLTLNDVKDIIDPAEYPYDVENADRVVAYDIDLYYNDEIYTPEDHVTLKFGYEDIGFTPGSGYMLYHIHENKVIDIVGPVQLTEEGLTLSVSDFSEFIFANLFSSIANYKWTGAFNKDTANVYTSFVSNAEYMTLADATTHTITVTHSFGMYDGTTWYRLQDGFTDSENGRYYRWVKHEDLFDIILDDQATGITVTGTLPDGVQLSVIPADRDNISLDPDLYPLGANAIIYDISLSQNGQDYQPETPVKVTFPSKLFEDYGTGKFYIGYHIHDDGTVDILGPYEYTGKDIVITLDSFSIIALSEAIELEGIPFEKATFVSDSATVYTDYNGNFETLKTEKIENLTEEDILIFRDFGYGDVSGFEIEGVKYYFVEEYLGNRDDLKGIFNEGTSRVLVRLDTIKEYVEKPMLKYTVLNHSSGITVSGKLPEGTSVLISPILKGNISLGAEYPLGKKILGFDISLYYKDSEYQPEDAVTINFPQGLLGFEEKTGMMIYHIGENTTDIIGPIFYAGKGLNLTVSHFSEFVFTDTYGTSVTEKWAGLLQLDEITYYNSPLPDAASYTVTGVYGALVRGEYAVKDAEGTIWLMADNGATDINGKEYIWLKGDSVLFTYFDGQGQMLGEEYTFVAPLVKNTTRKTGNNTKMTPFSLVNPVAEGDVATDDGLVISKIIKNGYNVDTGTGTIRLEAYVTGAVETQAVKMPSDIVLVLDVSGSMIQNNMKRLEYKSVDKKTAQQVFKDYENTTYAAITMDEQISYYPVTITEDAKKEYVKLSDTTKMSTIYNTYRNNLYYYDGVKYHKVIVEVQTDWWGNTTGYTLQRSGADVYSISGNNPGNKVPEAWIQNLYYEDTSKTVVNGYIYSYTYTDANGNAVSVIDEFATNDIVNNKQSVCVYNYVTTHNTQDTRLEALKRAAALFVDEVENDAKGKDGKSSNDANDEVNKDNVDHAVAVVVYSGFVKNQTRNTGVYNGTTLTKYETGISDPIYRESLKDMDTPDGVSAVESSINAISSTSGTRTDLGVLMAREVFRAKEAQELTRYVKDGEVIRNKIVVLFTDGTPTDYPNVAADPNEDVAKDAINYANELKNKYGATVYTIGVVDKADARIRLSTDRKQASIVSDNVFINQFLHYVSSNYKNSTSMTAPGEPTFIKDGEYYTGESYYLTASDTDSLEKIFKQIGSKVSGGASIQLGSSAVAKDIITPYFKIPEGKSVSDIKVYTSDRTWNSTTTTLDWATETEFAAANIAFGTKIVNGQTVEDRKTINVTNFNFSENWVGTTTDGNDNIISAHGKKLIIEIPFISEPFFMGGNNVVTNEEVSGVYVDGKSESALENFTPQHVDVKIIDMDIDWADQHIYRTNPANLDTLFRNATVTSREKNSDGTYDVETLENVLNGINNKYVNIVFTVKEKVSGNAIGTFTVNAGQTLNQGEWNSGANLTPVLDEDTVYELNWTISPSETKQDGVQSVSPENPVTAIVYVYNPVLTFKDDNAFYGETIPTLTDNQVGTVIWENATLKDYVEYGKTTTNKGNKMLASEPQLRIQCDDLTEGVTNKVITTVTDIPVNVTVIKDVQGGEDINLTNLKIVKFKHQDCSGEMYELGNDGETADDNWPAGAAFVVHVASGELKVSKTVVGVNGYKGPTSSFEFTVDNAANLGMKFTICNGDSTVKQAQTTLADGGKFYLADGEYAIITEMPKGDYTVTESDAYTAYTTTSTGDTGTIDDKTQKIAAFTNTLETTDLTVSKTVSDIPAGLENFVSDEEFAFTIKVNELAIRTKLSNSVENGGTFKLKNGEYVTFTGLPVGATYTVTEVEHEMFDVVRPSTGIVTDTLSATSANEVEFVNSLNLYELTITKDVNGKLYNATDTFIFNVSGPYGFTKEIAIEGEDSVTIKDLPYGKYIVVEDTNWSFRYDATNATQEVILNKDTEVTFENTPKSDNKWLDSAAYAENIFADSNGNGSNAKTSTETN